MDDVDHPSVKAMLAMTEAELRTAIDQHPDDPAFVSLLGFALHNQSRHDDAWSVASTALRRWPNERSFHQLGAICLMQGGRAADAEAMLQTALTLDPADSTTLSLLCTVNAELQRWPDVLRWAEACLRIEATPEIQQLRKTALTMIELGPLLDPSGGSAREPRICGLRIAPTSPWSRLLILRVWLKTQVWVALAGLFAVQCSALVLGDRHPPAAAGFAVVYWAALAVAVALWLSSRFAGQALLFHRRVRAVVAADDQDSAWLLVGGLIATTSLTATALAGHMVWAAVATAVAIIVLWSTTDRRTMSWWRDRILYLSFLLVGGVGVLFSQYQITLGERRADLHAALQPLVADAAERDRMLGAWPESGGEDNLRSLLLATMRSATGASGRHADAAPGAQPAVDPIQAIRIASSAYQHAAARSRFAGWGFAIALVLSLAVHLILIQPRSRARA